MTGPRQPAGGLVSAVEKGSDAHAAGIRADDLVVEVDGHPLADVIDWQWLTAEAEFDATVMRDGQPRSLRVTRRPSRPLGVSFADPIFDGVRECDNACVFCFVRQLPAGLRESLYVRDDDYRLSFLTGNFITLTNVEEADVARIVEQHLSPLHVSIHAVDPDVRRRLFCPTVEDRALARLDELVDAGIEVHAQVVLLPGVNDGAALQRTLEYLAERPRVLSVGVVPVGRTRYQRAIDRSYDSPDEAGALVDLIEPWRVRMAEARGLRWVHAADEFYVNARREFPEAGEYDEYPQFENGIGMTRAFTDEFRRLAVGDPPVGATVVTGTLFAPILAGLLASAGWAERIRVLPAVNATFGGGVTVAGLLAGADVIDAVSSDPGDGPYVLPDVIVNSDGLLLDGIRADDVGARAGARVAFAPAHAAGLIDTLREPKGWSSA